MSDDLPPDLERLRVVERYLELQLDAVRARIADLTGGGPAAAAAAPEVTWVVELRRTPQGYQPSVLHDPGCFALGGVRTERLSTADAIEALAGPRARLAPCALCTPERQLGVTVDRG
ncbi:DUF6233 domain-containing protein [Streptomyces sp. NBC_01304]|uniref:DUF6233 domain-containing protein n=1 Tax=Streptomyces sp. NBC_01304 TaxID=2903818 RepID=UPI002E15A1B1|nr:DUF6233 domain-containing protein [Streptomyces sp. NBC_01304]